MSKNWYKNSKILRHNTMEMLSPGSLWICREPHWYFYDYSLINRFYILYTGNEREKSNRHIKYVQQKTTGSFAPKEELITEKTPLFLTRTYAGIYYFQNKFEIVEMRSEFMYRFVKGWQKQ